MSRSFYLAFAVLLLYSTCSLLPSTAAWGGQGHNATARLAQSLFTPAATKLTRDLLPDKMGQIDSISSWADQVRDQANYTFSSGLHFVNTPDFDCHYDVARDCKYQGVNGTCVDGAVRNYTHRLMDPTIADLQQYREALEFLVHFAGDLHQPLHAGFAGDLGGNSISVNWTYGFSNNLHSLWDSGLIARRVALNFSNSYTDWDAHLQHLLQTTYKNNQTAWLTCGLRDVDEYVPCSGQWVQESAALCCQTVYVDEKGQNMTKGTRYSLGDAYYERNIDTLEMRIIQAGVRMAYVINAIAEAVIPPPPSNPTSSSSSSSSTGEEHHEESSFTTLDMVVLVIVILLVLTAVAFGVLYWRKRKYGLSSLFESTGGGGGGGRNGQRLLLDEDDSNSHYTRG